MDLSSQNFTINAHFFILTFSRHDMAVVKLSFSLFLRTCHFVVAQSVASRWWSGVQSWGHGSLPPAPHLSSPLSPSLLSGLSRSSGTPPLPRYYNGPYMIEKSSRIDPLTGMIYKWNFMLLDLKWFLVYIIVLYFSIPLLAQWNLRMINIFLRFSLLRIIYVQRECNCTYVILLYIQTISLLGEFISGGSTDCITKPGAIVVWPHPH